jgi:hypothetical protein
VLVQVSEAALAGQLVSAADPHPNLQRRNGRCVVFLDEDRQSIGQAVAHDDLA